MIRPCSSIIKADPVFFRINQHKGRGCQIDSVRALHLPVGVVGYFDEQGVAGLCVFNLNLILSHERTDGSGRGSALFQGGFLGSICFRT